MGVAAEVKARAGLQGEAQLRDEFKKISTDLCLPILPDIYLVFHTRE